MKRFKSLLIAGAAMLMFGAVSCNNSEGRPLGDFKDATAADSLIYYYGQMRAAEYLRRAEADTSLNSIEARKNYLRGVADGLKSLHENDESYNSGLRYGIRTATGIRTFENDYGVRFNDEIFLASLRYALLDEKEVDFDKAQDDYFEARAHLNYVKNQKEQDMGLKNLANLAKSYSYTKVTDELFIKVQKRGEGRDVRPGDRIMIDATYSRENGFNIGVPSPEILLVGEAGMPEIMIQMYCQLNKGESAKFMTTAGAIFGERAEILALRLSDVIVIDITLKDIVTPVEESKATYTDTIPAAKKTDKSATAK